ncbi:MAG: hypothetical protein JW726_04140 [Anaerolineales bacterium]|nr:hypothetical protein [Anaerolineales bacterium]
MSLIQKIFTTLLPRSLAEKMEVESREWIAECPCGAARSIWELGGIRWGAAGNPRRLMRCSQCGQRTWHRIYRISRLT